LNRITERKSVRRNRRSLGVRTPGNKNKRPNLTGSRHWDAY